MAMRRLTALALLALCAGAAAAASDACAPSFNWFPTAAEIGEDIVINNKTCTGKQVCNFPKVWAKANQSTYMGQLDSSLSKGLLKVAFKQFGNQPPRLFFTPVSEFLEAGADVSACASSHMPASRHLLATAKVVRPGQWSYTVKYDGAAPVAGLKIAGQSGELDPRKLNLDGSHCAEVTINISGYEISGSGDVPRKVSASQKICWVKVSQQATATFDFDMCTNKKFTVNVSGIHPLAENLTQNGVNIKVDGQQEVLMRPVIHLFGRKNRTLDGKVIEELEYDDQHNPINFINKYIVLPRDFTQDDVLSFVLDKDVLDEGYYKLSAKVAMISQFPDLIELEGENRIIQADSYGEDVRGFTEFLGVTIVNETDMVGVQKSKTTLSRITSDRDNKAIGSGDTITFSWHFVGIGKEQCFHDGVELEDCSSPMQVTAKDMSDTKKAHTFKVTFTDVCGNKKQADYAYTASGVIPQSKVDYIPVSASQSVTAGGKARNSAAAPKGMMAAAGTALLLAALLL